MSRARVGVTTLTLLLSVTAAVADGLPTEQLPAGAMQEKAAAACTTCHEARIIVQQRLSEAAWTKELDKMIKWGAEVDPKDKEALVDYFSANFGTESAPYEAPRTTRGKKSKR